MPVSERPWFNTYEYVFLEVHYLSQRSMGAQELLVRENLFLSYFVSDAGPNLCAKLALMNSGVCLREFCIREVRNGPLAVLGSQACQHDVRQKIYQKK